jgi:Uncharacterized conserved protein
MNLYDEVKIIFTYNNNRIEGSEVTEDETRRMFENEPSYFYLFDYMIAHANDKLIKEFHRLLKLEGITGYKKLPNEVGGIDTVSPANVANEMRLLLSRYNSLDNVTLEDIIEFHYRFECIHPFQDGNGRVGRLIMFKECLKNNVMPFVIEENHKLYYYRGLKEYGNEKGWLTDTVLSSQDSFAALYKRFI